MNDKPTLREEIDELAEDISNLYGVAQSHRAGSAALRLAFLVLVRTIEDRLPGTAEILCQDLEEEIDRRRRLAEHAGVETDETEIECLSALITHLSPR